MDPRAEVAAALYAASATQAAADRVTDARLRAQRSEIERLRAQVRAGVAGTAQLRGELTAAQERYVAALASRDRAYEQEIAVFRTAVQDIASTAEGAAALARFNAGDEVGALAVLDDLRKARDAARQKRADIESAAEGRRIASLASEARVKGKVTAAQVIARYEEVTRLDPGVNSDWVELARLYRDAGNLSDSLRAARRASATARNDRELFVALHELGDALMVGGDGPGALAAYRRGLAIAESPAARDPAATLWQRDVSVSHNRIGDVLQAQGDLPGALAEYRKGLETAQALAARDPSNLLWQSDLSASHSRIGNVLMAKGDGPGALAEYRKGLEVWEALAARDPANTEWQRGLSLSHARIGDALVPLGDGPGALAEYRKGLAIAEPLAARDPANADWQHDLLVSHGKIGNMLAAQGEEQAALEEYRKALGNAEALAARDPSRASWRSDISVSHEKIGNVLLKQGDRPGALAEYRKALGINEALAARDPSNAGWQRALVVSYAKLGEVTGDRTYTAKALEVALAMQQRGILAPRDGWIIDELKQKAGR